MQLIGHYSSPFVRRVAVTANFLAVPYQHLSLSVFREFEQIRDINPLVKVPTLVLDDGEMLIDSSIIIDHLQTMTTSGVDLLPADAIDQLRARQLIGLALAVCEKIVGVIYETSHRPEDKRHAPWLARLQQQLQGGLQLLERSVPDTGGWLFGDAPGQADITVAISWRFLQMIDAARVEEAAFPNLTALSARAEALPQFIACQP